MATVTIDGRDFDIEKLSSEARQQITNITAVDQEIGRLQTQIVICQTARNAYLAALQQALPKE
jgi:hypothetical protein